MTYDAQSRNRYRAGLTLLTGVTAAGALTACGWLAGVAADQNNQSLALKAQQKATADAAAARARAVWQHQIAVRWAAAHPRVRTVWRTLPTATVVDTRVAGGASVGTGGSVASAPSYSPPASSGGGGATQAAPAPPPPPPPPPAPSSGSHP